GMLFMSEVRSDPWAVLEPFEYANDPVGRAGGQMSPVRAPRQRPDRSVIRGQGEDFAAGVGLPDLRRAVQGARGEERAARAPRQRPDQPELRPDSTFMPLDGQDLSAGGGVPDADRSVVAAGSQPTAVRAPGDRRRPRGASGQDARLLIPDRVPDPHAA